MGSIVSIAFFNFFGLSVTKSLSGGARAAIDACRTILIWLFSVQIGWEKFHGLQVHLLLISSSCLCSVLLSCYTLPCHVHLVFAYTASCATDMVFLMLCSSVL